MTRFASASFVHNFNVHFSPPPDGYNNRANSSCVYYSQKFNSVLLLRLFLQPVWHPQLLGWSINGCILPGQADSLQEISTWMLVRLGMDLATFCDVWSLKQPELMPFGHISFLVGTPTTPCLPTTSYFCLVSFYSAHDGDSNDILVMYRQNVRPGK